MTRETEGHLFNVVISVVEICERKSPGIVEQACIAEGRRCVDVMSGNTVVDEPHRNGVGSGKSFGGSAQVATVSAGRVGEF